MDSLLSISKPTFTIQESFCFPLKVLYENRYCNQDDFSVLICGRHNQNNEDVKSIYKLYGPNFECKKYTNMPEALYDCKTAVINSDLFVFKGFKKYADTNTCVRKFCNKTKTWSCKRQSDLNFNDFIICSFKQNLFLIKHSGSCFLYNFETNYLSQLADMNERRH